MSVRIVPPSETTKTARKVTRTKTDTIIVSKKLIETWKPPPFQRPLKVNAKVLALAAVVKADGVIPGVITLGVLDGETYLLDGQHRVHAFVMSELEQGYADVRYCECENLGQMGEEFVHLNSHLSPLKPDDILRGLEAKTALLHRIRTACPFIGYDMIRRGPKSPIMSMSTAIRTWILAAAETPSGANDSAVNLALALTADDVEAMVIFYTLCLEAWGRDIEYARLWGALNLALCAWIYRHMVLAQYSMKTPRVSKDQFRKFLCRISAEPGFMDWLPGHRLNERDRSPAYQRLKSILGHVLVEETGKKPTLPQPNWG